jgi:hypothetical protein
MTRQLQDGVVIDEFLGNDDADCPVFGFNLACAYPFPEVAAEFYRPIASRLAALDLAVYVYPEWETHITLVTLVNFARNRRPSPSRLAELRLLLGQAIEILRPVLAGRAFPLLIGAPVLTPKAGILPITDPSGEFSRIRRNVVAALEADGELHHKLSAAGLNVPGIIHSTIMRFKSTPSDPARFAADFEQAAGPPQQVEITINELLLTTETKPYVREGSVAHRFPLAAV